MFDTLKGIEARYAELEGHLSDPSIFQDRTRYERISREHADLAKIITAYRRYGQVENDIRDSNELLNDADPEIKQMAREELERLTALRARLEDELKRLLVPTDPNDDKNVILEIRAGTGGDEAGLFAADLFRMYARYAEAAGWQVEILDQHATGVGGFKEIVAVINGRGAFSRLKFESGTHRVQRVPATETQGRVHTSAVTVAVLPEAEEVDVQIDPGEIKVDVYRSTGPGGQSVNTTDSAVRITHLPTGLVVTCQDEKSQIKNKAKALKVLRARLLDAMEREQNAQRSQQRKDQIGSGDRSERIRTYNYPQGRVTDHRIGLTLYKLEAVLQGGLDAVVDPLTTHHQARMLQHAESHSQRPVAVDHP